MAGMKKQVFISHHKSDSELVCRLDRDLNQRGIRTWLATREVQPGHSKRKAIYEGIFDSKYLIACLSPAYLQDEFCRTQLFLARAYNKRILPVLIGGFPPDHKPTLELLRTGLDFPYEIKGIEDLYTLDCCDLYPNWGQGSYDRNFEKLVDAIRPIPKPTPLNSKLFYVSYGRGDKDYALHMARDLELARARVWIDKLSIRAGDNWREAMYAGLRMADHFIIYLSPEAIRSDNVKHEVLMAKMRDLPIYPVVSERIYCDPAQMANLETAIKDSDDLDFLSDLEWLRPEPDYQALLTGLKKVTGLSELEQTAKQGIFISYRRADSKAMTGRIREKLVERFGAENVFTDVQNVPPGVNFAEFYENWLKTQADIALIIIGKTWATMKKDPAVEGPPRLHEEDDHVRIEVCTALSTSGLRVMPVLVDDAEMPEKGDLPECLQGLTLQNACKVRDDPDFSADIKKLMDAIENPPKPPSAEKEAMENVPQLPEDEKDAQPSPA